MLTKRTYSSGMDGVRRRGRQERRWREGVVELVVERSFSFEECEDWQGA